MARHYKNGLEYFSHDTNMKEDGKIKLLKAKYKLEGYAVYNLILEDIFKESYFLKFTEDYTLLFTSENKISEEYFREIINFMISKELFDAKLYKKYSILTSKRIQRNYIRGCVRRKNITLVEQYLLINPAELLNETEKKTTTIINVSINGKSVGINADKKNIGENKSRINSQIEIESKVNRKEIEIETKQKENGKLPDGVSSEEQDQKTDDEQNNLQETDLKFNKFWKFYNRRQGDPMNVLSKFKEIIKSEKDYSNLITATRNYNTMTRGTDIDFVKYPINFLDCYKDFIKIDN